MYAKRSDLSDAGRVAVARRRPRGFVFQDFANPDFDLYDDNSDETISGRTANGSVGADSERCVRHPG